MPPVPARDRRPLVERVRPARPDEIVGQAAAVGELMRWADAWSAPGAPPVQRAALLEGPPGVGKTTAALAVARAHGWTVVEMNASDARNEGAIEQIAGRASLSMTLGDTGAFRTTRGGGRALILLDEADCLSGRRTEESAPPKAASLSFRDFVRDRYGSLDELAKAWKLGSPGRAPPFAEWADLPATGGRAAWTRTPEAARDLADWRGAARTIDRSDRGGLGAIAALIPGTRQPLVLTVNDPTKLVRYSAVFRRNVLRIRFAPLTSAALRALLQATARREDWTIAPEAMEAIVRRARGDARAALNDLEAIHPLPPGPLQLGPLGGRDRPSDEADLTAEVLAAGRYFRNAEIRERLDAPPDDLFPWIEENLPRFAGSAAALAEGFAHLAVAEQLLARARRFRVFSLWPYAGESMTGGVSLALAQHGGAGATRAAFPSFLGLMGQSRLARGLRDSAADKVGAAFHLSRRKARAEFLPFLEHWLSARGYPAAQASAPGRREALARTLGLTREELALLAGLDPGALAPEEPEEAEPPAAPPAPTTAPPAPAPPPEEPPKRRQRRLGDFGG